jgi:hypothetical protein
MSTRASAESAPFLWATRGRTWGFRFLRKGGIDDPLGLYEDTFSPVGDQPEGWCRVGANVALRFPDPDGRRDVAGRVIPHDFVLLGSWADEINSLDDGRQRIWGQVADEYERVWDSTEPPSSPG